MQTNIPIHEANLSNLLAEIAESLAQYSVATERARRAYAIMARLGDRAGGPEADCVRVTARVRLGSALRAAGQYREAESWLTQALALAESTGCELPAALNHLGVLLQATGGFMKAERLFRRALRLVPKDCEQAATLHRNLAKLAHAQGCYAQGEPDARRAWQIRSCLLGASHPETLADACAYAALLEHLGAADWSERMYRHAIAVYEQLFGPLYVELGAILRNLAGVLAGRGETREAEALYRRAMAIQEHLLGPSNPDAAFTWHAYAAMLADHGRTTEALPLASRASSIFEANFASSHPWRAAARKLRERLNPLAQFQTAACLAGSAA